MPSGARRSNDSCSSKKKSVIGASSTVACGGATPSSRASRSHHHRVFRRYPARDVGGVLRLADGKPAAVKVEHHWTRAGAGGRGRWAEDLAAYAAGRRRNGDLRDADLRVEFGGAFREVRRCDWLLLA